MLRRSLLSCSLLSISAAVMQWAMRLPAWAQQPKADGDAPQKDFKDQLQAQLDKACRENNLPAMWAGRFSLEAPPVICASGVRKFGQAEKAEPLDIVHLGSCTKAMTAVLIGQLCSEGKLELARPLKEIFNDDQSVVQSSWSDVTVQELLQHRSGSPANLDYHAFDRAYPESVIDARRELLRKLVARRRPKKPAFLYSNVGYILLGHILEKLENKPWEDVIAERLFKPLDMQSASFGPVGLPDSLPAGAAVLPGRAWGHIQPISLAAIAQELFGGSKPTQWVPEQIDNARCLGPAGRVHMNLQDWSKFVIHFAQSEGYGPLKITPEVWQALLTPHESSRGDDRYAGGWILVDNPQLGKGFFHNGSNTTWYCYAFAVTSEKCCVLVATNVFNQAAQRECDAVARKIVKPC